MITTGSDEYGEILAEQIAQFIVDTDRNSARSLQRSLGPSEAGEPCERQLAYKLLGIPESNSARDPIAAIIGTGFHMWMAQAFENKQVSLPDGGPRYLIEERVAARNGMTGTADLYDRLAALNNDWKLVGISSLDRYRRQGPGPKYRVQGHIYGMGQENAGRKPARVAITFIARHHELQVHVWSEPYDRQIAVDALARLDRIQQEAEALDLGANPDGWALIPIADEPTCIWCPWLRPGSDDLAQGCPGKPDPNPGASFEALIAKEPTP
ncbi:hypothetical protein [Streptomyces yangpuensis]|uniref:hypothetical protein n=1 Tax=Streptomyces yangpuensis TaxID=1648182 RepID=UPI0035DF9CE0